MEIQKFSMYQGDTREIVIQVEQDGEPMELNDVEDIIWVLSSDQWGRDIVLRKSLVESSLQISGLGEFEIKLSQEDTAGLVGRYFFQARVIDGIEKSLTVYVGEIDFKRSMIVE